MSRQFEKSIAFTLAEVLIVLGIIGVVAAITIPTLVISYQKREYVAGLQSAMSSLNNTFSTIRIEYECSTMACTGIWDNSGDSVRDLWEKLVDTGKLSIVKNCGVQTGLGCFSATSNYLDDTPMPTSFDNDISYAKAVLGNGISIGMTDEPGNCTSNYGIGVRSEVCGWILVDINGLVQPNKVGRDIFVLLMTNSGSIAPYGSAGISGHSACLTSAYGLACAGRIFDEGWEMNY